MNAPALRFKGFSSPWVNKKLGEITIKIGSGSTPRGGSAVYQTFGIPFIRSQNVNSDKLLFDDVIFISEKIHSSMSGTEVKANDILLNITGASIGRTCIVPSDFKDGNVNQHVCIIRPNGKYSPKFIQSFLSSSRGQNLIQSTQVGGGREGLNFQSIRGFIIGFPVFEEQTKIAAFLSSIDEKINHLTQKHELLEQYKKGVMQKIFSQEIRFKDDQGEDFSEWNDYLLSDIGKTYNGLTGKSGDDFGSGKNYITYKQIFDDIEIDAKRFELVNIKDGERQSKANYGDVFFTTSSETANEVGISSVLLTKIEFDLYLNSFCFGYRINDFQVFTPFFAKYLFNSEVFRATVVLLAQGSTRFNISKVGFMKIQTKIPCLKEQIKIADFLSAIDKKITYTKLQLKAMRKYKQGLLQQMFV